MATIQELLSERATGSRKKSRLSLSEAYGQGRSAASDDPLTEVTTSVAKSRDRLAKHGIDDPTIKKPSALDRLFGVLDTPGTLVRAGIHNLISDKDVDVMGEVGKALKGEDRIQGADLVQDLGVDNKWAQMGLGFVADVLLDPITYLSFGTAGVTKAAAKGAIGEIASKGVMSVDDIARALNVTDDAAKAIVRTAGENALDDTGRVVVAKLGKNESRDFFDAAYKAMGDKGGVKVALPFGRGVTVAQQPKGVTRALRGAGEAFSQTKAGKAVGGLGEWFDRAFRYGDWADAYRGGNQVANAGMDFTRRRYAAAMKIADQAADGFEKELAALIPDEKLRQLATVGYSRDIQEATAAKPLMEAFEALGYNGRKRAEAVRDLMSRTGLKFKDFETEDEAISQALELVDELTIARDNLGSELDYLRKNMAGAANYQRKINPVMGVVGQTDDVVMRAGGGTRKTTELIEDIPGAVPVRDPERLDAVRTRLDEVKAALAESENFFKNVDDGQVGFAFSGNRGRRTKAWASWLDAHPEMASVADERDLLKELHELTRELNGLLPRSGSGGISAQIPSVVKELAADIEGVSKRLMTARGKARRADSAWGRFVKADELVAQSSSDIRQLQQEMIEEASQGRRTMDLLMQNGYTADEAEQALEGLGRFREQMTRMLSEQRAAQVDVKELFGEGSEGFGYMRGMGPRNPENAALRETYETIGADTQLLDDAIDAPKQVNEFGKIGAPAQQSKTFLTPLGRLEGASKTTLRLGEDAVPEQALATELDLAILGGEGTRAAGRAVAGKEFADDLLKIAGDSPEAQEQVTQMLAKTREIFTNDKATQSAIATYDRILNSWKKAATVWNPRFPIRNFMSNKVLQGMEGMLDEASEREAIRLMAEVKKRGGIGAILSKPVEALDDTERIIRNAAEDGVLTTAVDRADMVGSEVLGAGNKTFKKFDDAASGVNELVENQSRLSVYLTAQKKGLSRSGASQMVDRTLYSYDPAMLTAFERNVMKRVMPFYTWTRKNAPHMADLLVHNPRSVAWTSHLTENAQAVVPTDKQITPDWLSDLMPVNTPIKDKRGNPIVVPLGGLLPTGDLDLIAKAFTQPKRLPMEMAGYVSPLLKLPAELLMNRNLYTGKELKAGEGQKAYAPSYVQAFEQLASKVPGLSDIWTAIKVPLGIETRPDPDTGDVGVYMDPGTAKALKDLNPWFQNVGKLLDENPRQAYDIFGWFTGIKPTQFDTAQFTRQDAYDDRRVLDDLTYNLRKRGKLPTAEEEKAQSGNARSARTVSIQDLLEGRKQ